MVTPSLEEAGVSGANQKQDNDLQFLENIGTKEDSLLQSGPAPLSCKITNVKDILDAQTGQRGPPSVAEYSQRPNIVAVFPTYRVAILLFDNFETSVDHVCRILHNPATRSLMKTFYLQISQNEPISPSEAALLLSIFALSSYFYPPSENSEVAATDQDAVCLSNIWTKSSMDILDYSRRNTSGTLEDIQAYILTSYVAYHVDGFSARSRFLMTAATSIARDLRLHWLDADQVLSTERETNLRSLVDREVKRRVFWHIAAADWLQSTNAGPQEGMYFINPKHVNVRLPKDCNDHEVALSEGNTPLAGGGSQPTSMAYCLARVRLAHLCREMTDTVPLKTSKLMAMPYEHIMALDKRFEDYLLNLPFFFQTDADSRERTKPLEMVYPRIPIMRYSIAAAAHSRRCRLHHRFLLRQAADPRYTYSRRVCLESARAVLDMYGDPQEEDRSSQMAAVARMEMTAHYTHLALVVMVMDLCFNRDEAGEDARKMEVKTALQMLERKKHVSALLGRSLDALRAVLQKHEVDLIDRPPSSTVHHHHATGLSREPELNQATLPDHAETQHAGPGLDFQDRGGSTTLDASFDELWQGVAQDEMELGTYTWDSLFSALDTQML
ncbi:hypothetical protein SLS62_005495 [Diatrype stigma]|uniref:Xylanolytic transcriptional activator regulatory domain-containing protein n=1 Tax=Diatrype stigma TaxID=117547 RepID=A0AAN9USJ8_9PEZI